jgi:hypothetical protein
MENGVYVKQERPQDLKEDFRPVLQKMITKSYIIVAIYQPTTSILLKDLLKRLDHFRFNSVGIDFFSH